MPFCASELGIQFPALDTFVRTALRVLPCQQSLTVLASCDESLSVGMAKAQLPPLRVAHTVPTASFS